MSLIFDLKFLTLLTAFVTAIAVLYLYVTRNYRFWKNLEVPHVKPIPFFGSLKDVILQRIGIGIFLNNVYTKYNGVPYVGIFSYDQPALVIRDLDLAKNILVKDAEVFLDHIAAMDEVLDPLGSRILFVLKGQKWKYIRGKLSPAFTSGKIKMMFNLVDRCSKELVHYLKEEAMKDAPINVRDVMSRFTIDVISSCAFGIDSNSLKNPNAEFKTNLQDIFNYSSLSQNLTFFAPKLLKFFRISFFDPKVNPFIRKAIWNTVHYREKNGIARKDFLDLMIEMRKKVLKSSSGAETSDYELEGDDFVAIAFNFLVAGFEPSSVITSYVLHELSLHPKIQHSLRTEITEVLAKYNNEVTYDCIQEMKYLDMVVSEILRMYPVLPFLDRKCTTDYTIPAPFGKGTITVPAGTGFYIPFMAFHYNPDYFPNPEKFDPERFNEENKQKRPNYCYLPFGEGPRYCIGMKFALMQLKTGLIHILSNFEVEACKNNEVPMKFKTGFFLYPEEDIILSFRNVVK